ncbi:MAG: SBBP repeat-containing protein [Bacteroidia bacterium]|nr:SBBP repeat-containing protein [Bacteroidia bacterium]
MKRYLQLLTLILCFCVSAVFAQESLRPSGAALAGFEENRGQMLSDKGEPVPDVFFKSHVPGMNIYLTTKGITYVLVHHEHDHGQGKEDAIEFARIDMNLAGANISRRQIRFEQPLPGFYNYYLHHCPQGITNVQRYQQVIVKDVYPGIDWLWHVSAENGLKYDFVVHPGASPDAIRMVYQWADVSVNATGSKVFLKTPLGEISEGEVESYCDKIPVSSRFVLKGKEVRFETGAWDKSKDLIIDPPLALMWGTYIGGDSWEKNTDIDHVIDAAGNNFVACNTLSSTYPTQNPGGGAYFQGTTAGPNFNIQGKGGDVGIMKFDNAGVMLWSTYYGGSADDNGNGISCDANGNIYVTGNTESSNFPLQVLAGAFNQTAMGASDAFLLKFDNNGVRLWATHVGGGWDDVAFGIDVDVNNNVLLTGQTASANLPLVNAGGGSFYQSTIGGINDIFIMRFDPAGVQTWGTFAGSVADDWGNFIITDGSGKVYLAGTASGTGFPTVNPGNGAYYEPNFQGGNFTPFLFRNDVGDAVFMRFSASGVLEWSTYYGGTDNDAGRGMVVDRNGNIYVTGDTRSGNTISLQNGGAGSYNQSPGGQGDAFYMKFNAQCQREWATTFGGSDDEQSGAIIIDSCGNIYGTGHTFSNNMPTVNPGNGAFFIPGNLSNDDVYFVGFNTQLALTWSTYNGTTGFDEKGTSIEVDPNGRIFAVGYWCFYSNSNGVMNPGGGAYVKNNIDADDFFIMKFDAASSGTTTAAVSGTNNQCFNDCIGTATATASGSCQPPFTYLWIPTGDTVATLTGLCADTYSVIVTDAAGVSDTAVITITAPPPFSGTISNNITIEPGDTTTLVATGGGTYLWSTGDSTSSIVVSPSQTTTYSVIVFDANGCPDTLAVTVTTEENCARAVENIIIPNVFTPNADGINDLFEVAYDPECIVGLRIDVWDRWGWKVHEGGQTINWWDGRYRNDNNKYVTEGVYYYIITGTSITGEPFEKAGFVHVSNPPR